MSVDSNSRAVALRRPAIHASTLVRSDVEHTFDGFVRHIGAWWPIERLSGGRERVRHVTFEPRVGGRVYETWDDGTTRDWGQVTGWEPPHRFTMTWLSTPVVTEVELAFTQLGAGLTRVTVEHRGWDAFTDEQLAEDCADPGGYSTGSYDKGWRMILDRFAERLPTDADAALPEISDEFMGQMLGTTREYTVALLREGPAYHSDDAGKLIWEHGRRNFALRAAGHLAIVCPVLDDSQWCGVGIFRRTVDETRSIMDGDPGVLAGVFEYEVHPVRSFPGDRLPS